MAGDVLVPEPRGPNLAAGGCRTLQWSWLRLLRGQCAEHVGSGLKSADVLHGILVLNGAHEN